MKNFYSYLDRDGHAHELNLNGYAVQMSLLDVQERERIVYNAFYKRALQVAKYYHERHDMSEVSAVCFIASGLYAKFLDIRARDIKRHDDTHYNGVEYCAMLKTFKQLRYALDRANCKPTTAYTQTYVAPRVAISFDNGRELVIPEHTVKGTLQERPDMTFNSKMFDIIDVVEMWDNRNSRKRARMADAINVLNDERDEKTIKLSVDLERMSDDDARAVRSKMARMSRDKNDLRHLTDLNGEYGEPCANLVHKCERLQAWRKMSHDVAFLDIKKIVLMAGDMSHTQQMKMQRFRERNGLYYEHADGTRDAMTRDELIYLFK